MYYMISKHAYIDLRLITTAAVARYNQEAQKTTRLDVMAAQCETAGMPCATAKSFVELSWTL